MLNNVSQHEKEFQPKTLSKGCKNADVTGKKKQNIFMKYFE